ncbi:MAG TPA: hypothetical protein DCQ31_15370 [Bacteroidales bacterium]|nr:hypothetical protein [Bacteroidales bacterium]
MGLTLLAFETELRNALSVLPYVKTIEIKPRTEISIHGILLKKTTTQNEENSKIFISIYIYHIYNDHNWFRIGL